MCARCNQLLILLNEKKALNAEIVKEMNDDERVEWNLKLEEKDREINTLVDW